MLQQLVSGNFKDLGIQPGRVYRLCNGFQIEVEYVNSYDQIFGVRYLNEDEYYDDLVLIEIEDATPVYG